MQKNLPYDRAQRVADEIYKLVSEVVLNDLSDPRLNGVRITRAKMTKDLRLARLFFHMGDDVTEADKKEAIRGLHSTKGYLKRRIGEEINLKFMPDIDFFYDDAIDTSDRIEELLAGLKGISSHE